jgi:hypothetical protein
MTTPTRPEPAAVIDVSCDIAEKSEVNEVTDRPAAAVGLAATVAAVVGATVAGTGVAGGAVTGSGDGVALLPQAATAIDAAATTDSNFM